MSKEKVCVGCKYHSVEPHTWRGDPYYNYATSILLILHFCEYPKLKDKSSKREIKIPPTCLYRVSQDKRLN